MSCSPSSRTAGIARRFGAPPDIVSETWLRGRVSAAAAAIVEVAPIGDRFLSRQRSSSVFLPVSMPGTWSIGQSGGASAEGRRRHLSMRWRSGVGFERENALSHSATRSSTYTERPSPMDVLPVCDAMSSDENRQQ